MQGAGSEISLAANSRFSEGDFYAAALVLVGARNSLPAPLCRDTHDWALHRCPELRKVRASPTKLYAEFAGWKVLLSFHVQISIECPVRDIDA